MYTVGYKADQKKKAFSEMEQLGDALKIHPQVVKRAQEEFANYRDKREAVQHYEVCRINDDIFLVRSTLNSHVP
jgi:hypothetical protein